MRDAWVLKQLNRAKLLSRKCCGDKQQEVTGFLPQAQEIMCFSS
jgi:hypothetical protein